MCHQLSTELSSTTNGAHVHTGVEAADVGFMQPTLSWSATVLALFVTAPETCVHCLLSNTGKHSGWTCMPIKHILTSNRSVESVTAQFVVLETLETLLGIVTCNAGTRT